MNRTSYIKGVLLQVSIVTTILMITSCSYNKKPEGSNIVVIEQNEARFENNKKVNDAQFLVNAAEINMEEIQIGKLAQLKGSTTQIKELGRMMEDAHTKLQRDLTVLAKSKMVTIPTSPTEDALAAYKDLNKKSGNDFDKAYADRMVSEHKDVIDAFEKASNDSNDADIRSWASNTLPDLRKHLDHSVTCQKNLTAYTQNN